MAEESENLQSGAGAATAGADSAGVATTLALVGASRAKADAFLDSQNALIADQRHHLREQFKQIRLGIWQQWLGVLLRVATAVMGAAVAAWLGFMLWEASHSNGLLIEPFSVPPELASRGLTGEVVAAKLLDHLTLMQSQTSSGRPAMTYANSWGEHGIKLEIPETGVSLAELDAFLREKLGHETRVGGEIVRTASGLSLTARAGDQGAQTVTGPDSDLDSLLRQSAEGVYRTTQPFRFAMYLATHEREDESLVLFETLAKTGSREDRIWSYNRWGIGVMLQRNIDAGIALLKQAVALEPDTIGGWDNLGLAYARKSQPEEALHAYQSEFSHLLDGRQTYVPPDRIPLSRTRITVRLENTLGAFHDAAETWAGFTRTGLMGFTASAVLQPLGQMRTGEHDLAAARAVAADLAKASGSLRAPNDIDIIHLTLLIDNDAGNWAGVLSQSDALAASIRKFPANRFEAPTMFTPLLAYAQARAGDMAGAEARIAPTSADCYDCLIARARIAELKGQQARADWWFARAVNAAPSVPFADACWGQALLGRGDLDGAISKFTAANRKSPHFADPLEMWGEALTLQKHPGLALVKFEEAEKYAPNWGRLHLKWGEALIAAGRGEEANKQFAAAAGLDLTALDKAELSRLASRHG